MKMTNFEYVSLLNPAIVKHEDKGYLLYLPSAADLRSSIYLAITEKILPGYKGTELIEFFKDANQENFQLGEDWYASTTLKENDIEQEVPEECILEDFVDSDLEITDKFSRVNSTIDYIERFYRLNILANSSYTEEDIMNFASTFATAILDYAEVQNQNTVWNTIYMHVLQWLQNSQNDTAMTLMNLIFSGNVTVTNQALSNCGCTKSVDSSVNNVSCYDMYIEALKSWVATMFGDLNFYYDWFFVSTGEDTNEPNEEMIDMLIEFIEELKKLNLSLKNDTSRLHNCGCVDKTLDVSYVSTLDNYIKVLNFVKECKIEENSNKIKTWGAEFGGILPNLIFS